MKIAMWSGPRNLSTALMYSFGARPDFAISDEPYYAAYLAHSGVVHPMQAEVLAAQSNDPAVVSEELSGSIPGNFPHFYMKHMVHHMLSGFSLDWMDDVTNVFLIRHPARVVASYAAKREDPTLQDLGFAQQAALLDHVLALGQPGIVIASEDIRADPEQALRGLCAAIGLEFDPSMLKWPAGGHPDDGVWAPHWYNAVHKSTEFQGAEGPLPDLTGPYLGLVDQAMPFYEKLRQLKL